jgi:hypothetical protein
VLTAVTSYAWDGITGGLPGGPGRRAHGPEY